MHSDHVALAKDLRNWETYLNKYLHWCWRILKCANSTCTEHKCACLSGRYSVLTFILWRNPLHDKEGCKMSVCTHLRDKCGEKKTKKTTRKQGLCCVKLQKAHSSNRLVKPHHKWDIQTHRNVVVLVTQPLKGSLAANELFDRTHWSQNAANRAAVGTRKRRFTRKTTTPQSGGHQQQDTNLVSHKSTVKSIKIMISN